MTDEIHPVNVVTVAGVVIETIKPSDHDEGCEFVLDLVGEPYSTRRIIRLLGTQDAFVSRSPTEATSRCFTVEVPGVIETYAHGSNIKTL